MKYFNFSLLLLFFLLSSLEAFSQNNYPSDRQEKKKSLHNDDMSRLKMTLYGLIGNSSVNLGLNRSGKANYSYGVQILYHEILGMDIGLDLAYNKLYDLRASDLSKSETYFQTLIISETSIFPVHWFGTQFQFGVGPYVGIEGTKGVELELMSSFGLAFRFSKSFEIHIMNRIDWIYFSKNDNLATFSIELGVSYYIDL